MIPGGNGTSGSTADSVPVVILGGTGDGLVVLEILRRMHAAGSPLAPAGFLNDALPAGERIADLPVLGALDAWRALPERTLLVPALHKLKDMPARIARIRSLGVPDGRWARIADPGAVVAADVVPGPGSCIGPCAVIQPGATVGAFASIRAGANAGHDAGIADFAYVGPNAVLCGGARLGVAAHMGPCAVLDNNVSLGDFAILGAASVALRDIPGHAVAMGNPARIVERRPTPEEASS